MSSVSQNYLLASGCLYTESDHLKSCRKSNDPGDPGFICKIAHNIFNRVIYTTPEFWAYSQVISKI